MRRLNYKKLRDFIALDVIQPFYRVRLSRLGKMKLSTVIKRKNPYLFKAKNIETAGEFAKYILDAFLSSQEETIFGDLMENLAIHVCHQVFRGKKAEEGKFKSVDLIFKRDGKIYIVGIKSGPNWGNSDQVNTMRRNFKKAKQILMSSGGKTEVIAVNGCMYRKDNSPRKVHGRDPQLSYYKFCGQLFWEFISGDNQLYKKIIQPLNAEAKRRDQIFRDTYVKKINEMTKDLIKLFYTNNVLDWDKIVDHVSKNTR